MLLRRPARVVFDVISYLTDCTYADIVLNVYNQNIYYYYKLFKFVKNSYYFILEFYRISILIYVLTAWFIIIKYYVFCRNQSWYILCSLIIPIKKKKSYMLWESGVNSYYRFNIIILNENIKSYIIIYGINYYMHTVYLTHIIKLWFFFNLFTYKSHVSY